MVHVIEEQVVLDERPLRVLVTVISNDGEPVSQRDVECCVDILDHMITARYMEEE